MKTNQEQWKKDSKDPSKICIKRDLMLCATCQREYWRYNMQDGSQRSIHKHDGYEITTGIETGETI